MDGDPGGEYDVVVVGGGPGGSTVATFVAMQGHRVLLLEREQFPRYQIGESLLPSTVHGICRLLGVSDEVQAAGFMPKRGGTFRWGTNPEPWTFAFAVSSKFQGPTSTAYQVERMKFDQILLDNAARRGVDVRQRCSVVDVIEEEGRVRGVRYHDPDGVTREARARFVVDASGNRSRIHGRVGGTRHYSSFFRNIAMFGYFEGGKRLPAPNQGNILCVAFDAGWFWYIPLTDELTSVGAVLRHDALDRLNGDRDQALTGLIEQCPMIADYLADAKRASSGPYDEVRVRKDYSYCRDRFWKPGMVLVGDAACFIDPVFSSGVHLATYSGLMAARSINTALRGQVDEAACFDEFEARYRREYVLFHDFLVAFYDTHQDENSYFWQAKKVTSSTASDLESFVDLVGGGASNEAALVSGGALDEAALVSGGALNEAALVGNGTSGEPAPGAAEPHPDRRGAAVRELAGAVERPVGQNGDGQGLFQTSLVRSVMKEGARIQAHAALGENVDERVPIMEGGLIPSVDGMHWVRSGVR